MRLIKFCFLLRNWFEKVLLGECKLLVVKAKRGEDSFQAVFFEFEYDLRRVAVASDELRKLLFMGGKRYTCISPLSSVPYGVELFATHIPRVETVIWSEGGRWNGNIVSRKVRLVFHPKRFSRKWLAHCWRAISFVILCEQYGKNYYLYRWGSTK
ncbi:hypothetical protein ACFL6I_10910 [candidate division KSB1 bacterium]